MTVIATSTMGIYSAQKQTASLVQQIYFVHVIRNKQCSTVFPSSLSLCVHGHVETIVEV